MHYSNHGRKLSAESVILFILENPGTFKFVLRIQTLHRDNGGITSVADPDPGSGAFLTPGSGIGKKNQDPDPG
jgi:hypothetical protein